MARKAKTLPERVAALREAVEAADGRIADDLVQDAKALLERIDRRLAFSGDVTVVALAGATGSGKSSLFNAVSGTTLAEPGVRRPTTSKAMAASFGKDNEDLLDWLDVPRRHLVTGGESSLDGLVLLDLPDHDSTETSHRLEVDRLVKLVDQFVWVVDPQKYADAALHDGYLRPLAAHADVMLVALNQVDKVGPDAARSMVGDLRRLLDKEGLSETRIMPVSAMTGEGVAELRAELAKLVASKKTAAARLAADLEVSADKLRNAVGEAPSSGVPKGRAQQLDKALGEAAGVPVVVEAVLKSWRHRGKLATGWPVVAWLEKFRPDPLKALRLDFGGSRKTKEIEPARVNRTSLPTAQGVQKARVDSAVRSLADDASAGLPRGWADAVRRASKSADQLLPDHLDRAIATTDLALDRSRGWWSVVRVLQWLLILTVLVGLGWLTLNFVLVAYLALPELPVPKVGRLPLPTLLAIGGVAGVLLALLSRVGVELGARAKALRAESVLRDAIGGVSRQYVVGPVNAELERHERAREALSRVG